MKGIDRVNTYRFFGMIAFMRILMIGMNLYSIFILSFTDFLYSNNE